MRQVYRLLSLVKKWGAERVEAACATALEAEAADVYQYEHEVLEYEYSSGQA
jgi:hypothetical protein